MKAARAGHLQTIQFLVAKGACNLINHVRLHEHVHVDVCTEVCMYVCLVNWDATVFIGYTCLHCSTHMLSGVHVNHVHLLSTVTLPTNTCSVRTAMM